LQLSIAVFGEGHVDLVPAYLLLAEATLGAQFVFGFLLPVDGLCDVVSVWVRAGPCCPSRRVSVHGTLERYEEPVLQVGLDPRILR
jgi:hypothetical protein